MGAFFIQLTSQDSLTIYVDFYGKIFSEVGDLLKEERKFINSLSIRTKFVSLGVIIILLSIFVVDFSFKFFLICYLLGVFLIFISDLIGIEKFNKNAIGEITSSFGFVLIMLGVFASLGINPNFHYGMIIGPFFMLIGTTLKSLAKKKGS